MAMYQNCKKGVNTTDGYRLQSYLATDIAKYLAKEYEVKKEKAETKKSTPTQSQLIR